MKLLGIEDVPRRDTLGDYYSLEAHKVPFNPYEDNAGTTVAIAGKDYAVIASDTRLVGKGYSIYSRNQGKVFEMNSRSVLGSTGCWCDVLTFVRVAEARLKDYSYTHRKEMTTQALAQMMSVTLYNKRFFPYYISNCLAGLNEKGEGVLYSYDPVGQFSEAKIDCSGSAKSLIQPLLDNIVEKKNMTGVKPKDFSLDEALNLIHDCFVSAAERDINTGDGAVFKIITKDGVDEKTIRLRKD